MNFMHHHKALALSILMLLPTGIQARRDTSIAAIGFFAGCAVTGIIGLGCMLWKSMTNSQFENEKKLIDDVAAINPHKEFGQLLAIITTEKNCTHALLAYLVKNNRTVDYLYSDIVFAKNRAHESYTLLQTHAQTWTNNEQYQQLQTTANHILAQQRAALETFDYLEQQINNERHALYFYQTYCALKHASYVSTQDPFSTIHAVESMKRDIDELQNAITRIIAHYGSHHIACQQHPMVYQAVQKVDALKQTVSTLMASPRYREEQYQKLLADQKEKELGIQRQIAEAQIMQARALQDRVDLERKNYKQTIATLYDHLHHQQRIIRLLETEITTLRRLHGNEIYEAEQLMHKLCQLQQKIRELEDAFLVGI